MTTTGSTEDLVKGLAGFRYLERFGHLFAHLRDCGVADDKAKNRDLFYDQYVCLILLYFFSPTLTSLRGLQAATASAKVQKATTCERTSLGSLSEAPAVFDPELLRPILADLARRAGPAVTGKEAEALRGLTAVDGTFFRALPRMVWAVWSSTANAVKAHVHFAVLQAVPEDATVTVGACSEVEQLEATLKPDRTYVLDRGYACYRLFASILGAGSSVIGRVKENTAFEVREERAVGGGAPRGCAARRGGPETRDGAPQGRVEGASDAAGVGGHGRGGRRRRAGSAVAVYG
jgi:hypothetical protein